MIARVPACVDVCGSRESRGASSEREERLERQRLRATHSHPFAIFTAPDLSPTVVADTEMERREGERSST